MLNDKWSKAMCENELKKKLSVCIIAKNEEENIGRCLAAISSYGLEIILADTGSRDRTKEIAKEYTENIYEFVWIDDFSAAKNFAISKSKKPFVLMIDCDEFIEQLDVLQLEQMLREYPEQVGRICIKNVLHKNGLRQEKIEWVSRIFAKEKFYYKGCIHEQITSINYSDYYTYRAPIIVEHAGYDLSEEKREEKTRRNIGLLLSELERLSSLEMETDEIPYILYQLGKSYYMAGNYKMACEYFARGLSYDLNPKLEYVIDMVETYGYALINSNRSGDALFFENIYEEFGKSADFQFLMGLIYMNNVCFEEAVAEFQKATQHSECKSQGVNSYLAYYNIGVIYECLEKTDLARRYYGKCGKYPLACERLEKLTLVEK